MFSLICDCIKFEDIERKIYLYFYRYNNKIKSIEVFDEENQRVFYFKDLKDIKLDDKETLEFIRKVLEDERINSF